MFAKLAFSEDLNRGDAGKKRVQEPGKQIPVAGVFESEAHSRTVMFLPASLRVSAVKFLIALSKSARNKRANGPRAMRIAQIVEFPDTKVRDTLNFLLLA